jgi:hypothetical protein
MFISAQAHITNPTTQPTTQNDRDMANFDRVRGRERILLVEDAEDAGEYAPVSIGMITRRSSILNPACK